MWVDSKSAAAVLGVSNRAIQKACANSKFSDKKICTIKSKILNFRYQDNSRGGSSGKVLQIWLDDELVIDAINRGVIADPALKAKLISVLSVGSIGKGKSATEFTKFSEFDIDEIPVKENSHKRKCEGILGGNLECDLTKTWSSKATKGKSNESFSDRTSREFTNQEPHYSRKNPQGEYLRDIKESGVKNEYNNTTANFNSDGGCCNADRDFKSYSDMDSAPNDNSFKNSIPCRLKDIKNSSETKFQGDKYVGYKDRAKTNSYGTSDGDGDLGGADDSVDDSWGVDSCAYGSGLCMDSVSDDKRYKGQVDAWQNSIASSKDKFTKEQLNHEDLDTRSINDEKNKANLEEIRDPHISSSKHNNADDSVDEFQSYAIEQKASHSLEELYEDININDSKKADAFIKAKVVKLWLKARDRKVKIDAFLSYININKMYDKKVSKGQIYDWARRYANGGIKGLVDERGGNRPLLVELLGHKEKVDELILSSQGKINSYNVYNRLHHHFVSLGLLSHDEFIGKEKEIIAYDAINRYVTKWKKAHPTEVLYIEKGYDGAVNSKLAAVGDASWSASAVNELVEIDATTLDIFAKKIDLDLASAIYKINKNSFKDFEECCERVKENQKRYTVVGLIDRYSGVCSYAIGKSENIYTVKRALAKYIAKFGLPQTIIGDNGKAFKSHEMAGTFESLDIEYRAVRAYSGWLKPYIERSWRAFQDNFSQNLAGFIGHSVEQRQAIEFGFSKMERRLKKGQKTNLKEMLLVKDLEDLMDRYIDSFMNSRWLDRLNATPKEIFSKANVRRLSALSVCARLGKMESKKIYKKGIMHDNSYFINTKIYAYDEVKIVANLNNSDEIYIWSCDGEFIGVGVRFDDGLGVSAEIAREARNYSKRKIDNARAKANEAARSNQNAFVEYVSSVSIDSSVAVEYADEQGAIIEREHKMAKSLKAMSVNLMPTKPKKKKEYSWEDLA